MTGTDLCVNNSQSVPVISEPPCKMSELKESVWKSAFCNKYKQTNKQTELKRCLLTDHNKEK